MTDPITLPANGSFSFVGRVALVTGAGRGIGEAIARELHAGGARVAISDVDAAAAEALALALDPTRETTMGFALDVRACYRPIMVMFLPAFNRISGMTLCQGVWGSTRFGR